MRELFILAIPGSHPLARAETVGVRDLNNVPFLMYSHSAYPPFNELLTGMFRSAQVAPNFVQWLGSSSTIRTLLAAVRADSVNS